MSTYASNESARPTRVKKKEVKDDDQFAPDLDGKGKRWRFEIETAQKDHRRFYDVGDKVISRYVDDYNGQSEEEERKERFNIFWSNVQTLGPAIYSRTPKPQVERRFKDKDQVGRVASQILERAVSFAVDDKYFDPVMKQSRDDYLLVARGQCRVWYDPTFSKDDEGEDTLAYEEVYPVYVHWKDFLHQPARYWDEVEWVAFRSFLSKAKFAERFPDVGIDQVKFDKASGQYTSEDTDSRRDIEDNTKKCEIWEIWNKTDKRVYWLAMSTGKVCESVDDPLGLECFFPCPRPLLGTKSNNSVIPYPDYKYYQDQAAQLDEMTARRAGLIRALKLMGVYDESIEELGSLLSNGKESDLIPVKNWMQVQQMGGLKGVMDFLPIEETANVYSALVNNTSVVKNEIYELTGISDIVRGVSDSGETATAQQIKGQYANLRLSEKQSEIQRFARDVIAIMGEIIAEKFSPDTIVAMAGINEMDQESIALVPQAIELLRNDVMREFRIEIETDSTVNIDEQGEKESRVEFTSMMTQYLQQVQSLTQMAPELLPLMAESMLFSARGFKVGRSLEGAIEDTLEQLKNKVQQMQQQPPPPSPEMMKAQADQQKSQAELQIKQQESQADIQIKAQESQAKLELMRQEQMAKLDIEREKVSQDHKLKAASQKAQLGMGGNTRKRAVMGTNEYGEREVRVIEEPMPEPDVRQPSTAKRALIRQDQTGQRVIEIYEGSPTGEGEMLTQQGVLGIDEQGNPTAEVVDLQ